MARQKRKNIEPLKKVNIASFFTKSDDPVCELCEGTFIVLSGSGQDKCPFCIDRIVVKHENLNAINVKNVSAGNVRMLIERGFELREAVYALRISNGDVQHADQYIRSTGVAMAECEVIDEASRRSESEKKSIVDIWNEECREAFDELRCNWLFTNISLFSDYFDDSQALDDWLCGSLILENIVQLQDYFILRNQVIHWYGSSSQAFLARSENNFFEYASDRQYLNLLKNNLIELVFNHPGQSGFPSAFRSDACNSNSDVEEIVTYKHLDFVEIE